MAYRIDEAALVEALDRRILPTLPIEWPGNDQYPIRSSSVSDHFDYLHSLELDRLPRDDVLTALVESANDALAQYSDGVSEDAREPYNGCVTIDGDLLRVRFGRVPRSSPDAWHVAPELEPISIGDILIEE